MRISEAQLKALRTVATFGCHTPYMPYADVARSYYACADKGLLQYVSGENHESRHNGFLLTDLGLKSLTTASG